MCEWVTLDLKQQQSKLTLLPKTTPKGNIEACYSLFFTARRSKKHNFNWKIIEIRIKQFGSKGKKSLRSVLSVFDCLLFQLFHLFSANRAKIKTFTHSRGGESALEESWAPAASNLMYLLLPSTDIYVTYEWVMAFNRTFIPQSPQSPCLASGKKRRKGAKPG